MTPEHELYKISPKSLYRIISNRGNKLDFFFILDLRVPDTYASSTMHMPPVVITAPGLASFLPHSHLPLFSN